MSKSAGKEVVTESIGIYKEFEETGRLAAVLDSVRRE